jgi:hypothetical protein
MRPVLSSLLDFLSALLALGAFIALWVCLPQ